MVPIDCGRRMNWCQRRCVVDAAARCHFGSDALYSRLIQRPLRGGKEGGVFEGDVFAVEHAQSGQIAAKFIERRRFDRPRLKPVRELPMQAIMQLFGLTMLRFEHLGLLEERGQIAPIQFAQLREEGVFFIGGVLRGRGFEVMQRGAQCCGCIFIDRLAGRSLDDALEHSEEVLDSAMTVHHQRKGLIEAGLSL